MTDGSSGETPAEPVLLVVGRIGRPHGVKGEVAVEVRTDHPDLRFVPGAVLMTSQAGESLEVHEMRPHSGRLLIKFASVDDRDTAALLRGRLLYADVTADATAVAPRDPDEYYDHELVGLAVANTAGTPVGTVSDVVHLPEQELLAITTPTGEVLVPFVKAIVVDIDLSAGRAVVDPPQGLLEI